MGDGRWEMGDGRWGGGEVAQVWPAVSAIESAGLEVSRVENLRWEMRRVFRIPSGLGKWKGRVNKCDLRCVICRGQWIEESV
jgi:hypothetical protein